LCDKVKTLIRKSSQYLGYATGIALALTYFFGAIDNSGGTKILLIGISFCGLLGGIEGFTWFG
jgi:Na+(H+)/acetate symporter ActP